jgi:protocatechuate 3,4-dioxygenase beta subunit
LIKPRDWFTDRRQFFKQVGIASLATMFLETSFAEELVRTPPQTEGPYYPTTLPLDTDNDLVMINDNTTPAVGQITYLSGRILGASGEPVRNAHMEIWHADDSGAYVHPSSIGYANRDRNFQGFGRFLTGSTGEYLFRTIKPGLYAGRTRHIHFKVKSSDMPEFTSQLYFLGEPMNASDGILNGIQDMRARHSVIVPLVPIAGSTIGALAARFDIVLGITPGSVPLLTLTNTSHTARNPAFRSGDGWRLDLQDASPASRVYLHIWKDNVDLGVSGPYGSLTGEDGDWSLSGTFGVGDAGFWQLQAIVGGAAAGESSAPIALRIGTS